MWTKSITKDDEQHAEDLIHHRSLQHDLHLRVETTSNCSCGLQWPFRNGPLSLASDSKDNVVPVQHMPFNSRRLKVSCVLEPTNGK